MFTLMETKQSSRSSFCRTVGCGHARSMHFSQSGCCLCGCDHFIAPQSPEARAIGPKLVVKLMGRAAEAAEPSPNARARRAA